MPDNTFRPMFQEHVALFRGIVAAWIDNEGDLNVRYADETEENLGPVSSFAYAVDAGIAGEGTSYPTFNDWAAHVVAMSQTASDAQAWAEGARGDTPVPDTDPAYHNNSKYYAEEAGTQASNASDSAAAALVSEGLSEDHAEESECWAVGTINGETETNVDSSTPGTTNNSKYYAELSAQSYADFTDILNNQFATDVSTVNTFANTTLPQKESEISGYSSNASAKALVSEGYALGTQNGEDVTSESDYHENNSKYFAEQAQANLNVVLNRTNMSTSISYQETNNLDFSELDPEGWIEVDPEDSVTEITPNADNYFWTRTIITYGTGDNPPTSTSYSVGYIGSSGTGAVDSVNGGSGTVTLTGYSIKLSAAEDAPTLAAAIDNVNTLITNKVVAYDNTSSFPSTGVINNIYIAKDSNLMYRWNGVNYVGIGGSGGGGSAQEMQPATDTTPGLGGTVPAPLVGDNHNFLCGDKSWKNPVTKEAIKTALSASQEETKKFLNENGEWKTVDADNLVHLTGTETITGAKTFTTSPTVSTDSSALKLICLSNGTNRFAVFRADSGDPATLTRSQIGFGVYSPKSTPDGNNTGYYELYQLPACNTGRTTNVTYNILTTKNAVGLDQGGTGATSVAGARTNLGLGTAATYGVTSSVTTGTTVVPTSAAVANFVNGKNIFPTTGGTISGAVYISNTTASTSKTTGALRVAGGLGVSGNIYGDKVYNAVWNDYAECRNVNTLEPGFCVTETSSGVMAKTWERLQPGCKLTSDTFGTCMGETDEAQTPIAVAGRVLAYPYRDISEYHLGDAVCSAPDGKIDVMSREEIKEYPERIVGTVSEIPGYDVWYGGSKEDPKPIQVNGRIWIYVR